MIARIGDVATRPIARNHAVMPWYSPLFRVAGTAVLDAARREFANSSTGQLFGMVQREMRTISSAPDQLGRALDRYSNFGPQAALRELRGTQFGQFAREVERYARGDSGMKRMLDRFLAELGPAGRLIKALTTTSGRGEVDQLVGILRSFGYEVLPPSSMRNWSDPTFQRAVEASRQFLESTGAEVTWPSGKRPQGQLPFGIPARDEDGQERGRVTLPMADGPAQRFGVDHPIVTGEMVTARSSNVHSFGYDIESAYLYIRFLGYLRGQRMVDGSPMRGGPGSLYRYRDVTPEEFLSILAANSKGEWIWDNLRVRGTHSGHQKDYELVGVQSGYVPRKASVRLDPSTGRLQEVFLSRRVRAMGGGWLTSALPSEVAGDVPWGQIDRGSPDRGSPDRGDTW